MMTMKKGLILLIVLFFVHDPAMGQDDVRQRARVDLREQAGEITPEEARNLRDRISRAEEKVDEMRRIVARQRQELEELENVLEEEE